MTAEVKGNRRARKRSHFERREPLHLGFSSQNNNLILAHRCQRRSAPPQFKVISDFTFEE
jgi:hypothetical protein